MNIIFYDASTNPDAWFQAFKRVLPYAHLRLWQTGDTAPADYAMVWKPPAAMLRGRDSLKAIFNLGAGVDSLLRLGDALPAGLPLVRVEDAGMGVQMAEYVMHAVLRYFRDMDAYAAQAGRSHWQDLPRQRKETFSIGVMGLGLMGQHIIAGLQGWGFPINGWSRTQKNLAGVACYAGRDQLHDFLSATRVLVCVLPMTPETADILNRDTLSRLPRGAYLINVARGAHLVEQDLLGLIAEGHIAAASLDVFREEPLPITHPFWQEPRIHITPHISGKTLLEESAAQIADKIALIESGAPITGLVDLNKGY